MESPPISQEDIQKQLKTTAIHCQNVGDQKEPLSIHQMEDTLRLLEATAGKCRAVAGSLSSPVDIVSWTFGGQSSFDQDKPVWHLEGEID